MPKTITMELIEAREGRPIREVLIDLYAKHGSIGGVADALRITRQALWYWMKFADLTTRDLKAAARASNVRGDTSSGDRG